MGEGAAVVPGLRVGVGVGVLVAVGIMVGALVAVGIGVRVGIGVAEGKMGKVQLAPRLFLPSSQSGSVWLAQLAGQLLGLVVPKPQ